MYTDRLYTINRFQRQTMLFFSAKSAGNRLISAPVSHKHFIFVCLIRISAIINCDEAERALWTIGG